jgi:hypothetical protein
VELRAALSEIEGNVRRIARAEGADAAALRAQHEYHRSEIGEELLQAKFRLRGAGNLLLHCGRMISEACSADDLLNALSVAPELWPEIQVEKGVPLLHAIFAHGGENSTMGVTESIDPDRQPMTWQFNLAMIDWLCRSDRGNDACDEAFKETFDFLPEGWGRKPSVLEKCGVFQ